MAAKYNPERDLVVIRRTGRRSGWRGRGDRTSRAVEVSRSSWDCALWLFVAQSDWKRPRLAGWFLPSDTLAP